MKTKIIIFESSVCNSQTELNQKIEELENEGYTVTNTQVVAGNSFSKYTSHPKIIITLQK